MFLWQINFHFFLLFSLTFIEISMIFRIEFGKFDIQIFFPVIFPLSDVTQKTFMTIERKSNY